MKRVFFLIVLSFAVGVFLEIGVLQAQAQPPFPGKPPWYIEITGLDSFSLSGPTSGTYTGSDIFTVGVNNPTGATVTSSISAFTPVLTNLPNSSVAPSNVSRGITNCTVTVSIQIILLDAPGTRQATLTITVTNT